MSWNAWLVDTDGHQFGDWNYTHNTNRMAKHALRMSADYILEETESWWQRLDGMSGEEGKSFLSAIISMMEEDPENFRSMNPTNGWGDYDSFLSTLKKMRDAVPSYDTPTKWRVSG